MTIIVANASLGSNNSVSVNSTSNSFVFKANTVNHEANSISLKVNTTTVNNSSVYVSGNIKRGGAGDVLYLPSSAPIPNGFLTTNTKYSIAQNQNFFNVYGHRTTAWTSQTSGTIEILRGIAYGNGVYAAVGENGIVTRSTDSITWSTSTQFFSNTMLEIKYDDVSSSFIAVGAQGKVFSSTDAITWTNKTGSNTTPSLWGVAYGNGVYVTAGLYVIGGLVTYGYIQTSPDATTWTTRVGADSSGSYRGVAYGNGIFVVVGGGNNIIRTSSDNGINWVTATPANTSPTLQDVIYANGLFVAVGGASGSSNGSIQTSTNGTTWTNRNPNGTAGSNTFLTSVSYGNGQFIVTGLSIAGITGAQIPGTGTIQTSTDGITWTQKITNSTNAYLTSTFGNGIYLTAGDNGALQTIDVNYGTQFKTPAITAPNNFTSYVRNK
jgi:hypothetical protein